jgi:hypothetical protein
MDWFLIEALPRTSVRVRSPRQTLASQFVSADLGVQFGPALTWFPVAYTNQYDSDEVRKRRPDGTPFALFQR